MNSVKIEMGAVLAVKNIIQLNDFMKDYINDNDKEPSWDGHIYLYKSDDLKAENIRFKVPVQIKGKNEESLLKKQRITYPVEYKHLRNYYRDGGVFYIAVAISDDKRKSTIFYNALTTVKLRSILKKSENKKPDQTKNIVLEKLKNSDASMLYNILLQFGFDREQQGSGNGEIIEKAINMDVLDKVDSVRWTSYTVTNEMEALKKVSSGEICLYGHRSDIDMWLPFDYEQQKEIQVRKVFQMDKNMGIDGEVYYKRYWVERDGSKSPLIKVSKNLTIDLINGNINFEMHGSFEELKRDVDFLYAMKRGHSLWVGSKKISEYTDVNLPEQLLQKMEMILDFYKASKEINFICDKQTDQFCEKDWTSLVKLVDVYRRGIDIKDGRNNEWYLWWWNDEVIPILVIRDENNKFHMLNWIAAEEYIVCMDGELGEKIRFPRSILFKRDVWEKLYDIDEKILLEDIEKADYSYETSDELYLLFVEVLSAYDSTKNEKYYDMATLLIAKLLEVDENNENGIINHLQLLKRKRELADEEISKIEKLEESTENEMIICAANILLENRHQAKKLMNQWSEEKQELFKNFPIYNLL